MREEWSLQDLYQAANLNPTSVIYDDLVEFGNGKRIKTWPMANYDFEQLLQKNMMHAGILFPKKAWEVTGGYPERMKQGREDWAFNVALGEAGYCGLHSKRAGYLYRREGQNRTLTNTDGKWHQTFLRQLTEQFPHLYRGERPMACCGGNKVAKSTIKKQQLPAGLPAGGDMVLLQFIGKAVGTSNWGGAGGSPSGRIYRFGNNPKDAIKYVERRDADWFLTLRKDGSPLFKLYEEPKKAAAPVPQEQKQVPVKESLPPAVVGIASDLTIKVQRAPEAIPDLDNLTVYQIRNLELSKGQWELVIDTERKGKNRIGVLSHAREKLLELA
jgi:hypothetical protein